MFERLVLMKAFVTALLVFAYMVGVHYLLVTHSITTAASAWGPGTTSEQRAMEGLLVTLSANPFVCLLHVRKPDSGSVALSLLVLAAAWLLALPMASSPERW
jgi:hypothetical protein